MTAPDSAAAMIMMRLQTSFSTRLTHSVVARPALPPLQAFLADGTLDALHAAFSRSQEHKVYVQHLMAAHAEQLHDLIVGWVGGLSGGAVRQDKLIGGRPAALAGGWLHTQQALPSAPSSPCLPPLLALPCRPHPQTDAARRPLPCRSQGAHVYVCGDGAAMAKDVHACLLSILQQQGGLSGGAGRQPVCVCLCVCVCSWEDA